MKRKGLLGWERCDWDRLGGLEAVHDSLPLDFGVLEVDQKTEAEAGGSEIVEALRGVGCGEAIHAFDFYHK